MAAYPPVLRQVDLILWSTEDCRENSLWESWESGVINESALCAGRVESKKTAIGDSGGPLVVPLPAGGWGQVGVHNLGGARLGVVSSTTRRFSTRTVFHL